jgi:hypothetical protein
MTKNNWHFLVHHFLKPQNVQEFANRYSPNPYWLLLSAMSHFKDFSTWKAT